MDEQASTRTGGRPRCPICGHDGYRHETSRLDSARGMTSYRADTLVSLASRHGPRFDQGTAIVGVD